MRIRCPQLKAHSQELTAQRPTPRAQGSRLKAQSSKLKAQSSKLKAPESNSHHLLAAMPRWIEVVALRLGDGEAHPAHRADVGDVHLGDVVEHWIRWRSGRDEPDGPHRENEDQSGQDEGDDDRHASDSMMVPLASPPPSHIVWRP